MILKSLELENIRSYGSMDSPVLFPEGITLFEGDIGAGKSTILYAIEFALFGLGEFKGSFLLRNGASRGFVTLRFEQDRIEYEVSRTLVKSGKAIKQEDCYIKGPSGKQPLTASDLKERILQILKFNEPPEPKAQSVIYRYAIFTPQEEMKEILKVKDSERRLQILRKAFHIESYKTALQNSSIISGQIMRRIEWLRGATGDIGEKKAALSKNNGEIVRLQKELGPLEERQSKLNNERKAADDEWKRLDKERENMEKSQENIPLLNKQIKEKNDDIRKENEAIRTVEAKVTDKIDPQISEIQKMKRPTTMSLEQLMTKKDDVAKRLKVEEEKRRKIGETSAQIPLMRKNRAKTLKDLKDEKEELAGSKEKLEGVDSEISELKKVEKPTEKSEAELKQEHKELESKLRKLEGQQSKIEGKVSDFDKMIQDKKCPVCERRIDSEVSDRRQHLKHEHRELQQKAKAVEKEIERIDELIEKTKDYASARKDLVKLLQSQKEFSEKIAKSKKSIEALLKEEEDGRKQIKSAEEEADKLRPLEKRISSIEEEKGGVEQLIEEVREYGQAQMDLKRLILERDEANELLKKHREKIERLLSDIKQLEASIRQIETETKSLKSLKEKLTNLQDRLKTVDKDLHRVTESITASRTSMGHYEGLEKELLKEIEAKEKQIQSMNVLLDHRSWLDEYFSPSLENIERHVMEAIRKRFNDQFQRWFGLLIEDDSLQVRVNEEFTPEIERDGYIQEYDALSGGERTSIALAYRIALNTLVHEVSAGGTSSLLILDEPTDGFSKEQLFRLRDILYELKCRQVIIVSHERELEGFANSVFKIENSRGVSRIVAHGK